MGLWRWIYGVACGNETKTKKKYPSDFYTFLLSYDGLTIAVIEYWYTSD